MDAIANFGYTTVTVAPSPATTGTSLTVESGAVFAAAPFNAVVWAAGSLALKASAEIVRVTNISTNVLTITRKQESTTARTIVVGDQIMSGITAKLIEEIIAALEIGAWTPLTLNATIAEAGSAIPECRREGSNRVRLRGAIKIKAGKEAIPGFLTPPKLANFPVGMTVGSHSVYFPAVHFVKAESTHKSSSVVEMFENEMNLTGGETLKSEDQLDLDGIVFLA